MSPAEEQQMGEGNVRQQGTSENREKEGEDSEGFISFSLPSDKSIGQSKDEEVCTSNSEEETLDFAKTRRTGERYFNVTGPEKNISEIQRELDDTDTRLWPTSSQGEMKNDDYRISINTCKQAAINRITAEKLTH